MEAWLGSDHVALMQTHVAASTSGRPRSGQWGTAPGSRRRPRPPPPLHRRLHPLRSSPVVIDVKLAGNCDSGPRLKGAGPAPGPRSLQESPDSPIEYVVAVVIHGIVD